MVADFTSVDYGWLRSPNGGESVQVPLHPSAQRDGYFTDDDIVAQVTVAMAILDKYHPDDCRILVYDNATTHLKRFRGAISARRMLLNTSEPEKNWLVEVLMNPGLDFHFERRKGHEAGPNSPGTFR